MNKQGPLGGWGKRGAVSMDSWPQEWLSGREPRGTTEVRDGVWGMQTNNKNTALPMAAGGGGQGTGDLTGSRETPESGRHSSQAVPLASQPCCGAG